MNATTQYPNDSAAMPSLAVADRRTPAALATAEAARWLALGAVAGPVLFTLAWVILGFVSPGYTAWGIRFAPYSPISQPISGLGLGPTAPFMNAAFVLYGLLLLVGVVGIFQSIREFGAGSRWTCTVLFALSALGAAMDGIFTLQSFFPHFVGYGLGSGMPVIGFLVTGLSLRRIPHWRRLGSWLLLASPLTLVLLALSLVTFNQSAIEAGQGIAGLTERILILEAPIWFVAMGWLAFRRSS
jgi:hypothetical protein